MATSCQLETFSSIAEPPRVDREKNIIYGAALMQIGQLRDSRGWYIDEITLEQALQFSTNLPPNQRGMLSNYKHKVIGEDSLGTQLGYWDGFRIVGDTLRGDLHLVKAAFSSVEGDLGTYVLDLSEDLPESFGVSADPILDREAMKRDAKDGKVFVRFKGMKSFDVVGDPAATHTGMFGSIDSADDSIPHSKLTEAVKSVLSKLGLFSKREDEMENTVTDTAQSAETVKTDEQKNAAAEEAAKKKAAEEAEAAKAAAVSNGGNGKSDVASEIELNGFTYRLVEKTDSKKDLAGVMSQQDDPVNAETKRCKQIMALCKLAKCPDQAETFIDAGFSVSQVQDTLGKFSTVQSQVVGAGLETGAPNEDADPVAQFKKQYQETKSIFGAGFSMSEEEFITSMKVSSEGGIIRE